MKKMKKMTAGSFKAHYLPDYGRCSCQARERRDHHGKPLAKLISMLASSIPPAK
ncbi:MAG TPA: hypothetical protein VF772_18600 [Terriglobales bacterium]